MFSELAVVVRELESYMVCLKHAASIMCAISGEGCGCEGEMGCED
jgi:hypothetical protein